MTTQSQTPKVKRVLTPEQLERLVSSRINDAARRANPPAPSQPDSLFRGWTGNEDEDGRSFPGVR